MRVIGTMMGAIKGRRMGSWKRLLRARESLGIRAVVIRMVTRVVAMTVERVGRVLMILGVVLDERVVGTAVGSTLEFWMRMRLRLVGMMLTVFAAV